MNRDERSLVTLTTHLLHPCVEYPMIPRVLFWHFVPRLYTWHPRRTMATRIFRSIPRRGGYWQRTEFIRRLYTVRWKHRKRILLNFSTKLFYSWIVKFLFWINRSCDLRNETSSVLFPSSTIYNFTNIDEKVKVSVTIINYLCFFRTKSQVYRTDRFFVSPGQLETANIFAEITASMLKSRHGETFKASSLVSCESNVFIASASEGTA